MSKEVHSLNKELYKLTQIKRVLLAIRNVNKVIMKETDPRQLLKRVCANLTGTLGYYNAWIAMIDHGGAVVAMTTSSGFDRDFAYMRNHIERGEFPACMRRSFELDELVVVMDPQSECPDCPLAPSEYFCRARLTRFLSYNGNIYGVISVSVPVIYARDAEEQDIFNDVAGELAFVLHKIETEKQLHLLKHIFASIPQPMSFVSRDYCYLAVNDIYEELFNTAREQILGHTVADFYGQAVFEAEIKPQLDRCLAGEAVHYEVRVDLPGKGARWMDMRYYPYRDERSEITGVVSHGLDITVRKQAENALRDSEEKYRSLAVNIPDIVYSFDKDRNIITINPPAEKMFGYQSKKIIGNHLSSFVYPQDRDMYLKTLMEAVKNHQKYMRGLEFRIFDKTGDTRWVEMHCHNQFDEHGNFLQQDGVLRDITETKLLQDRLMRSERLVATGQLAASIAHEINSPLQGITSLLHSIERIQNQDKRLFEKLNLVKSGFISIRDTVKKLLDLNRPGKEREQSMNINSVIEDTVGLLTSHLKKNQVKIILNLSSKVPNITASPQQLGQVFMNLISNAVEAMVGISKSKDGLETRESTGREITINSNLKKDNIIIKVADTGPGISKEDMEHIFDPFYTRKKEMGMGIGLSICHGIVEDHNGSIAAKNLPEGGAVFTITLPIR